MPSVTLGGEGQMIKGMVFLLHFTAAPQKSQVSFITFLFSSYLILLRKGWVTYLLDLDS